MTLINRQHIFVQVFDLFLRTLLPKHEKEMVGLQNSVEVQASD